MINESFRFHVVHRKKKKKTAKQSAGKPHACFFFLCMAAENPIYLSTGNIKLPQAAQRIT